jgi:hypothetical protein
LERQQELEILMKIKHLKAIYVLGVILIVVSGLTLVVEYIHDREINYPTGLPSDLNVVNYYEITSASILSDLRLKNTDIFRLIDTSVNTVINDNSPDSFSWSQENYLIIADALNQMMSIESGTWKLYGMVFYRTCQDQPVGFDSADITYYGYSNQQENYLIHQISIYPGAGIVSLGEGNFRRPLFGWKSISLNRLMVSADIALHKAEENGGKEFRANLNNRCNILLVIKPNPDDNDWLVSYSPNDGSDMFRIYIDPYTGWYQVIDNSR